jgi:acyl-CoA oxidase
MGHGSNVRGLETTAVFDKATDSFILNSPTLKSAKMWPGDLGRSATHCILHARLIIGSKDHGV